MKPHALLIVGETVCSVYIWKTRDKDSSIIYPWKLNMTLYKMLLYLLLTVTLKYFYSINCTLLILISINACLFLDYPLIWLLKINLRQYRSSRSHVLYKVAVLKSFTKFSTVKSFFINVTDLCRNFAKKRQ